MSLILTLAALGSVLTARAEILPEGRSLDWEEADLSARLMDGAHRFAERKIA